MTKKDLAFREIRLTVRCAEPIDLSSAQRTVVKAFLINSSVKLTVIKGIVRSKERSSEIGQCLEKYL
jgi:hypothetical protein